MAAGAAAHHIVAGGAKKAAEAQRFDIGINEASNGVFLQSGVQAQIHTSAYYEAVNAALMQATTRRKAGTGSGVIRQAIMSARPIQSKPGIYTPLGLDGYELCHPVMQDDFERINVEVNGTSRQSSWNPIPMRVLHDDERQTLVASDSPWLGAHALIFRRNVVEALGTVLREYGELLPLACSAADIVMYNPTRVIDVLDEAASSVLRFSSGRIMLIQRHIFRADAIGEIDVFKIPNLRVSPTFVSHRFVDRWNGSDLKGLRFIRVWTAPK